MAKHWRYPTAILKCWSTCHIARNRGGRVERPRFLLVCAHQEHTVAFYKTWDGYRWGPCHAEQVTPANSRSTCGTTRCAIRHSGVRGYKSWALVLEAFSQQQRAGECSDCDSAISVEDFICGNTIVAGANCRSVQSGAVWKSTAVR